MEKERYTIEQFELDEPNCIFDNKTQNVIFTLSGYHYDELSSLMNLLNQQDARIKELEEQLSTATMYHGCDVLINELKQENQQLKEDYTITKQSKEHFKKVAENVVDLLSILNKELPSPQLEELNYKKCIDDAIYLIKENKQLKQLQNQKAIEVLQQAKIEFETYYADNMWNYAEWFDDKIKMLRGEQ